VTGRSPARLLAPISLVVTVLAFFLILTSGGGGSDAEREVRATPTPTATSAKTSGSSQSKTTGPKTYRVKPGDTPSTIAEQAGISLETLLELNPNLDPQALSPGQKLKLRP
jgi:LysM repeat protein